MAAIFQTVLMRLALYGLAASLALMLLRSRLARDTFARLLSVWRSLTAFGRVAVCSFLLIGILIGGDKTNSVPPNMNSPLPQMQQGGVFLTGFTGLTGLHGTTSYVPSSLNLVNLVNPVQTTPPQQNFAERKAMNWNVRGAWKDSFWLPFDDGWVFPWGTNHLSGVEVISYGQVWATPFDTNAVASADTPVEIVPGLTTFGYEFTPSNSYRFVWNDAAINRDTNNLVSAAIELFRDGDILVTTNGVATHLPRELPISHNGFGQDDEWVTANFTNATEILAVGYPQWIDAQVGEGLTNGLYKLTVSVADNPPETTLLSVGDLSVAITNAGEYVFLLGKCIDYPLAVFPETATNFVYAAVDDIVPALRGNLPLRSASGGYWSDDERELLELVVPYCPNVPLSPAAHIKWLTRLSVSPVAWFPTAANPNETFTAILDDVPFWLTPHYTWSTSDPTKISIASPSLQTTQMTCHDFAAIDGTFSLALSVLIGSSELHSYFYLLAGDSQGWTWSGTEVIVETPSTLFINNDDDDADSGHQVDWIQSSHDLVMEEDIVEGRIALSSDAQLSGYFSVDAITGLAGEMAPDSGLYRNQVGTGEIAEGWSERVYGGFSQSIYLNPSTVSTAYRASSIYVTWTPDGGTPIPFLRRFTVVEPVVEPVCNATTNVTEGGVEHAYTVNPCGVGIGHDAYFRIEVSPADYPDENIVWSCESAGIAEVLGDGTGRAVTVRGISEGEATLSVQIGDCRSHSPTFPLHVVPIATVNLRAWIIEGNDGKRAFEPEDVRRMVKDANDVYAQVGVTLNLIEPIVITNIPDAYDALFDQSDVPSSMWTFEDIVDIASGTGGLECYFINSFVDTSSTKAAHNGHGIVVTSRATQCTLAHEIGHAIGMHDIYETNADQKEENDPLLALLDNEKASFDHLKGDWNGGCDGSGSGGVRYYRSGTSMKELVGRMLMLGEVPEVDVRRDITAGCVYGVYYEDGANQTKIWHKGNAPVACPWANRSPVHQ